MINGPFQALGKTVTVTNSGAVQVPSAPSGGNALAFRIRNLSATVQYFTWGQNPSGLSVTAPSAGSPSTAIGMLPTSVETMYFPANSYFIADNTTGFEFTPGEGV